MKSPGAERKYSALVYAEQIRLLYKNAPTAYIVTLVNGAILAFVQSPHISTTVLLAWYGCLVLVTAGRALIMRQYARSNPGHDDAGKWNRVYFIGTILAGSVWGATAFLLFPAASAAHQMFVAVVLAGMAAGGISVLSARIEVCLAFLLPALLPLAIHYFFLGSSLHIAMGIMTLIFLMGMTVSALTFHRSIRTSLTLRFDKRELETEIAERQRVERALFLEKDRLQTVLNSMGEGVALVNAEGRLEYLNPVAEKICGWSNRNAMQRPASEVFKSFDIHHQRRINTAMEDSLLPPNEITRRTAVFFKSGDRHFIEELATPLYDREDKLVGAVSVLRDVTEAMHVAEQLVHAANHDPLTGLPNRNLLKDRINQAIARMQRNRENFAILFLDLDYFKGINDSMGHAIGDALLVNVAKRLADCIRKEDTVARLGGDEFVVLLAGPTRENQVHALMEKIRQVLREPYQLGKQTIISSVSIGASFYPIDGEDPESLLAHADAVMYEAKQKRRA